MIRSVPSLSTSYHGLHLLTHQLLTETTSSLLLINSHSFILHLDISCLVDLEHSFFIFILHSNICCQVMEFCECVLTSCKQAGDFAVLLWIRPLLPNTQTKKRNISARFLATKTFSEPTWRLWGLSLWGRYMIQLTGLLQFAIVIKRRCSWS